jgi:hypothetical protein
VNVRRGVGMPNRDICNDDPRVQVHFGIRLRAIAVGRPFSQL